MLKGPLVGECGILIVDARVVYVAAAARSPRRFPEIIRLLTKGRDPRFDIVGLRLTGLALQTFARGQCCRGGFSNQEELVSRVESRRKGGLKAQPSSRATCRFDLS